MSTVIIDIKRPPTATQVEEMRKGLTQRNGIIALGNIGDRTQEGIARRGMGEWKSAADMGERGTHCWFVLTQLGRDYLAKLDGTTPVAQTAADMTREDVEEGKRQALSYLGFGERRRTAEQAPASQVLKGEFLRVRKVMRHAMENNGAEAAHQALKQYNRTEALLMAARRFEQEDAAQEAAQKGSTLQEQTYTIEVTTRVVSGEAESCRYEGEDDPDHECTGDCTSLEGDVRELEAPHTQEITADADDLEAFEGDPVAWAVDYIRTKTDAVEPSGTLGDTAREHEWLSGSYTDPYDNSRVTETTVRLTGDWTGQERARVFKGVAQR